MRPNPRLLFCAPFFSEPGSGPHTGGLIDNFHLVRALAATGARVMVLSLDRRAPNPEIAREFNYEVLWLPLPRFRRGGLYFGWIEFLQRAVRLGVEQFGQLDIAIATTSTLPALASFRASGAQTVAILRAYENFGWKVPSGTFRQRWQGLKRQVAERFASKAAIRSADLVIAASEYLANQTTRAFGRKKVEVLYPCLDLGGESQTDFAPEAGGRVGFVARGAGKNFDLVSRVARLMPDLEFHVFGYPPAFRADSNSPNLRLRGWESDRMKMFTTARTWIVPSAWEEPFGRVALEGRALGCSVLVSAKGGLPEAVDPRSIVWSFDPSEWVIAIRRAVAAGSGSESKESLHELRERFGLRAHDARVQELFGPLLLAAGGESGPFGRRR